MKRVATALTLGLALISPGMAAPEATPKAVSFKAADGLSVSANFLSGPTGAPLILLFHMADSNKSEYRTIAPRLNAVGFGTLAVDARSGHATNAGDYPNLTAEAYEKKEGTEAGYSEAYPDLVAALKWARKTAPRSKVFVLGSSYSANLVFRLAVDHPGDVSAVMAFSPTPAADVVKAATKLKVPVFVTSADSGREVEDARAVLKAVGSARKIQFVPQSGRHGADALSPQWNRAAEDYWKALLAFLSPLK